MNQTRKLLLSEHTEWNVFEAKLFNLLIESDHNLGRRLTFSERMRIADAMLLMHDAHIEHLKEEQAAQGKLKLVRAPAGGALRTPPQKSK